MSISITLNSSTLSPGEAGAVVALLMALQPDAVQAALERMDEPEPLLPFAVSRADAEAMERGTPEQSPVGATADPGTARGAPVAASPVLAAARPEEPLTPEAAFGASAPLDPVAAFGAGASALSATSADTDLDAEGLPWDERIHSSNRKRSANGVWMKRRGLNQLVEQKVRAELRETYPEPETPAKRTLREAVADGLVSPPEAGAPIPPVAPPPPAPPAPTTFNDALEMSAPAVPAPIPPVSPPPPAPPPPSAAASAIPVPPPAPAPAASTGPAPTPSASGPDQFAEAMKVATAAQAQGVITAADTIAIATGLGLTSLRDLVAPANAAFIPQFRAGLDTLIAERTA